MNKKVIAGIFGGLSLAGGGTAIVADTIVNPYIETSTKYEIKIESTMPEAGEVKNIVSKDEPAITLSKWNGEVALKVKSLDLPQNTEGARPFLSKKVEWQSGNVKMEAVPLEPTPEIEDGGMEINIILDSQPSSNVFSFQLDNWQNLDFFFQDKLWREQGLNSPTKTCDANTCKVQSGTLHRPDNVIDSYAVFYKNHANHIEGKTNYATGKAYHIYRPLVTDAKGNTIWADLSYNNGVLTITVPQNFLDTANYPVTIDPTFGYTTIGATTNDFGGNVLYAKANSTPASNGTMTQMNIYGKIFSGSPNFNPALYTDVASAPNTRLAFVASGGTSYGAGVAWVTTTISYGSITAGTQYWLGFLSTGAGPLVNEDTGGTATLHFGVGGTWNATADDVGNEGGIYSIYADYNESLPPNTSAVQIQGQVNVNGQMKI